VKEASLQVHLPTRSLLMLCTLAVSGLLGRARAQIPAELAAQQKPPAAPAAPQTAQAENTGNQVLHILVGHSVVIRTDPRLQRVLVGNPAVVTTATTSPNEVVVTAIAPGSSSVILWQENNQSRIIEVFADVDVSLLREAITRGMPGEAVEAESEEGRVVLTGTASSTAVADQIGKMAAPFSKEIVNSIQVAQPHRQKQILVKVRFAQVDRSKLSALGFNLFSTPGASIFGAAGTQQFAPPQLVNTTGSTSGGGNGANGSTIGLNDLLNIFIFRRDINLGATIKALQQQNVLEILAEPDLLAANGEPARFLAGGELPYPVLTGSAGQATVTVQFKPFGVKLEFTGTIESDNTIRLKVFPEVSSLDFTNAVTISGFLLPAIATRHAETVVELRDGQSFGIAGLLDQRTTAQFSKVPGIGDIPILGQLFRSRSVNKLNSELIVIVTPTIVDPAAAPTVAPEVPKMPITPLDQKQFDKKTPHGNGSK
jgi:pilus assembly protein CpaC